MGGRRRRTAKRKTMKGGNFVGVGQAIAPGVLERTAVANTAADPVTGGVVPEIYGGGRRRRSSKKTKKGGRKSRKVGGRRRRTMKGGASYVGSANSGASFGGTGIGGMADYKGYASNVPGPGGSSTQVNGVWQSA